jgi:hypothetical protein
MTIRPRLVWSGLQWMCWSRAIFGGRIVGVGATPAEAYRNWERTARA